jgi:CBS domain-containing protein
VEKSTKTAKQLLDQKKQAGFIAVGADSTVLVALQLMADKNIGAVLVLEDEHLVGIFSERDYARKGELQNRAAATTPVRDVMTQKVVTVRPDQSVESCRKIMGDMRIRHLPVVEGDRIVGVLSSKDTLDEIIAEDEKVIRQLETERQMTARGVY